MLQQQQHFIINKPLRKRHFLVEGREVKVFVFENMQIRVDRELFFEKIFPNMTVLAHELNFSNAYPMYYAPAVFIGLEYNRDKKQDPRLVDL